MTVKHAKIKEKLLQKGFNITQWATHRNFDTQRVYKTIRVWDGKVGIPQSPEVSRILDRLEKDLNMKIYIRPHHKKGESDELH